MSQCRAAFFDHTDCENKKVCDKNFNGQNCPNLKITLCANETFGEEYCPNCKKIRAAFGVKSPTMIEVIN